MDLSSKDRGALVEVSRNYFAINRKTSSVFYFGEDVDMYTNGKVTSHEGSWRSGVAGARYGLAMPGQPLVEGRYYQEYKRYAPGIGLIQDGDLKLVSHR